MATFGPDFKPTYNVKPTNSEFASSADSFIYCSNGACGLAGSGLCPIYDGPAKNLSCRQCNQRFPSKPNGKTFGGLHYKAMLAGKPNGKGATVIHLGGGGKGNGGGGKGAGKTGGKNGGVQLDRMDKLESALIAMATSIDKLANPNANGGFATQFPTITSGGNNRKGQASLQAPNNSKGANSSSSVWAAPPSATASADVEAAPQASGVSDLLSKVQSEYAVPAAAASQIAEIIINTRAPSVPAVPILKVLKPSAISQKLHEEYQASLLAVQGIRGAITKGAARLETLYQEQDELHIELRSLDGEMAKAKLHQAECHNAFTKFEQSQNSVSAKAGAEFNDATLFDLCDKLYQVTAGNPLFNQLSEMLKSLGEAHSKKCAEPTAPVAGKFPTAAAASTVPSDFTLAPAAATPIISVSPPAPPAVEILELSGTTADTSLDQGMGLPTKRQAGSGDEQRSKTWKSKADRAVASRVAVADIMVTVGIGINTVAPTADIALSNSFGAVEADAISDFSYGEMADTADNLASPSYGDMAPPGDDGEIEDPALGGRPSNPTLLG